MRKLFVATATVAIFALLVSPAIAKCPGGGGVGPTTGTRSKIALCKVDGLK